MPRTILVVDDNALNRQLLIRILQDDYAIVEAKNGVEALEQMRLNVKTLSAVLLDIMMPEMDGFEVLRRAKDDSALYKIPIIVVTGSVDEDSRVKALSLGANDFIVKPSDPEIIKHCLKNNIALRETEAAVNALQRDKLTGLYNRESFIDRAEKLIASHESGFYVVSCFDIDNFKVINDQYGTDVGDEVLKYVAGCIKSYLDSYDGICCRASADNFCMLYPRQYMDSEGIHNNHKETTTPPCISRSISVRIGRYIVNDPSLSVSAMLDRALLAKRSVKGKYGQYVAQYDEAMRERLLFEQQIVANMLSALKGRQFEVWFQPQYNHTSGALVGAEGLVRWRHPEKGLIPPYQFIPVFEKNGFIYELDKYVWEEVCSCLRRWTNEGRAPLPVSVNISRYDLFQPDLVSVLTGLVERYGLPVELLRLEITESAFAESSNVIVDIVKKLVSCGFTVEIDDFGSGYSSLNTLKNVPAQIVKLDMRFLESDDGSQRGGNILESIVRMTKWLGMAVIAEGVEEKAQADFLESIGCSYIQGYLYAKPMPIKDYEALARKVGKEERLLTIETVENLDSNAFWDPKSLDTLIFNSYVGAACIFEYCNRNVELLRSNAKFASILGDGTMSVEDTLRLDWIGCLIPDSLNSVRSSLRRSAETGEEFTEEYAFKNIPGTHGTTYLRATMRVIAVAGQRQLVYCTSENISAQRTAEQNERVAVKQLQAVMDNVNCGISATTFDGTNVRYLLINDKCCELLGYSKEQCHKEASFSYVHPDDRQRVIAVTKRVHLTGEPDTVNFRAILNDKSMLWLQCFIRMTEFEGVDAPVQLTVLTDVTAERLATQELMDNLPNGTSMFEYDGSTLSVVFMNKSYWKLVDREPLDYTCVPATNAIHPNDRTKIKCELDSAIQQNRDAVCDIRIQYGKEGYRPFRVIGKLVPKTGGKYSVFASYMPLPN